MSEPPEKVDGTEAADDWELQRDEAKEAGDAAFRAQNFEAAIQAYSTALSLDPENAKILSNRSAAYLQSNQKSKALYDAQKCVELGTMGIKGQSRLAAALQALGRFNEAQREWKSILEREAQHAAALKGVSDCEKALRDSEDKKRKEEEESKQQQTANNKDEAVDELDDFFNEVEEVTEAVVRQKQEEPQDKPTEAIKSHKKDLGTAKDQIDRLLAPNYKWRNLNPFFVLDIFHNASEEEISRRYKALSLLLHPDKNPNNPRAQEAYDEVLQAKAKLNDENKANHARQLVEQGMKQGKLDWQEQQQNPRGQNNKKIESLDDFQSRAVQKIFAQIQQKRQEVEERHRKQEQRERQQEEEALSKERESRKFDKNWKEEDRVDKRIGNWRNFQKKKKPKSS
ncbi:hypothetical protein ACA910_009108 [Epithemia clementina (nom. ined.)]